MVYGRWCPKRVRGTGQAGQTSLAGWARQGRSRGSICVYRATRVWGRRCSDTSAIIALRLAPIRPSRQHYAHLLVRVTPPPLTRRRPPYLLRLPTARAASGPDARVAMGRLPGNKSRAEARSLGDNVVSGTRTRRRSQERSPVPPVHLPCLCCSLLPQCCANAQASAHLTPLLTPLRSSRTRLRRGPPYAPALRHPSACPPPDPLLCRPTMVMRRTWRSQLHKSSRPCSLPSQCAHPPLPVSWFTELTCSCPSAPVCPPSAC